MLTARKKQKSHPMLTARKEEKIVRISRMAGSQELRAPNRIFMGMLCNAPAELNGPMELCRVMLEKETASEIGEQLLLNAHNCNKADPETRFGFPLNLGQVLRNRIEGPALFISTDQLESILDTQVSDRELKARKEREVTKTLRENGDGADGTGEILAERASGREDLCSLHLSLDTDGVVRRPIVDGKGPGYFEVERHALEKLRLPWRATVATKAAIVICDRNFKGNSSEPGPSRHLFEHLEKGDDVVDFYVMKEHMESFVLVMEWVSREAQIGPGFVRKIRKGIVEYEVTACAVTFDGPAR
jgi:hypothetical protein